MEKLEEEKKLSLDEKIELNLPLNEEELKELNKRVEEREKKEDEEKAKLPKNYTKPKRWDEAILEGEAELPPEFKIENGEVIKKTIEERYKENLISKEAFTNYQRKKRNAFLFSTDKFLLEDFPISAEELKTVKSYREYLRNIPQNKKFPDIEIKTLEQFKNS